MSTLMLIRNIWILYSHMKKLNNNRVLLFGPNGKVGSAMRTVLKENKIICVNHSECDVSCFDKVEKIIEELQPGIVINAAGYNGLDACESDSLQALRVNTLFPKVLAELSNDHDFVLIHFSTDAVFEGKTSDYYLESSVVNPINMYGLTKFGADSFISAIAKKYYIARLSIQFGPSDSNTQFLEKMLAQIQAGNRHLRISKDIIASPSYSMDVANTVKAIVENDSPYGLYHIANHGKASLYELMREFVSILRLDVIIEPVPHAIFNTKSYKNPRTPITSEKLSLLRPWQEALVDYCQQLTLTNNSVSIP